MVVPYSVPLPYIEAYLLTSELSIGTRVHETFLMVSLVVISIKFAIQQYLKHLSSMHSLCALRSAYTGQLPADLSHATRMNMGKSSVIV